MTSQDLLTEIKKLEREGYKIEYRQASFGSWAANTLMDGWDCTITKGDTSRQLGLYLNPRMVHLSVTGDGLSKVNFEAEFSQQGDLQLMADVMTAILGMLAPSADLIIHGTEDELTNELMQPIYNAVSAKLAERGATDCRYTGTLFDSRPEAA